MSKNLLAAIQTELENLARATVHARTKPRRRMRAKHPIFGLGSAQSYFAWADESFAVFTVSKKLQRVMSISDNATCLLRFDKDEKLKAVELSSYHQNELSVKTAGDLEQIVSGMQGFLFEESIKTPLL